MPLISIHVNHRYPEIEAMNQNILALIEQTAALRGTVRSAAALLANLAGQIEELKNDPAQLQALADDLRAANTELADAVIANDGDPTNDPGYVPPVDPTPVDPTPVEGEGEQPTP